MSHIRSDNKENDVPRPPCYLCGETYAPVDIARHTEPVSCDVCPGCNEMPTCFMCRNMYCSCLLHQH